jgi:REP element-mobilizing transposase RayT
MDTPKLTPSGTTMDKQSLSRGGQDVCVPREKHKEWNYRGYLPHFDHPELIQGITFHLGDSLPTKILEAMKEIANLQKDPDAELRRQIQKYLDAGHGLCYLEDSRIAKIVEQALFHFDGKRYKLLAWVIMPNHVHALIETVLGYPLGKIVQSWKSFTANEINKLLKRKGQFWQEDYFDRFIRNQQHFDNAVFYIHNNPVKAGLVKCPEDFPYSSARYWISRTLHVEK